MRKIVAVIFFCFLSLHLFSQRKISIYWDVSYSMRDRDTSKELLYLDNYFKKYKNVSVNLIMFSNEIVLSENYLIDNSNWGELRKDLQNSIYDGGTSYDLLFKENADEYLLFTDGIENVDKLNPSSKSPIYIISTLSHANITQLKYVADVSSGAFVYLNSDVTQNQAPILLDQSDKVKKGYVSGIVAGKEGKLANTSIINTASKRGISSNANGLYRIKANEGDLLVFTYLGKKTINVRVGKSNIININMSDIDENLDEIVIRANTSDNSEELMNTGNGYVDKKKLGFAIESIDSDAISSLDVDVQQAVQGQFSGLYIQNDTAQDDVDLTQFLGRGKNMTITGNQYGLVVIDGVALSQSDSSDETRFLSRSNHIDPSIIENITYLKGLVATMKYGSLGKNGVLLITTKSGALSEKDATKNIILGTTPTYKGNAKMMESLPNTIYINALKKAKNIDEAFIIYLGQRETYGASPLFYLDVYEYFKGWNNAIVSDRILSNIFEVAGDNVEMLRAMSYRQQESGDFENALKTVKYIQKLEPKQSQSYRDLALLQRYAGHYQEALMVYDDIAKNLRVANVNTLGIKKTISNEGKNLVSQYRKNLNISGISSEYLKPIKYKVRILFEWNNLDTEFDLSIINPQNRFYTWSHTLAENSQRISQQKQFGYGLEEFYLTESDQGEWTFNMKYYGTTSNRERPTFVKITMYKNFGQNNQSRTIKTVRLSELNTEQTVSKLIID